MSSIKNLNHKGQMLVEVVAAVVIGAIALTVILRALTASYRSAVLDQEYTRALVLLESRYQNIVLKGLGEGSVFELDCPAPWTRFRCKTSVLQKPAITDAGIDRVRVAVSWPSGKGNKEVAVSTLLAGNGH